LEKESNLIRFVFLPLSTVVLSISPHLLFAFLIPASSVIFFYLISTKDVNRLFQASLGIPIALLLNFFWLVPLFLSDGSKISEIGVSHLYAFAPDGSVFNAMYSMASMHGFWRQGYVYAKDIVPATQWLFIPILFFSVHGFMKNYRDQEIGYIVKGLGSTWIIALLLGVSVSGPFPGLMEWLYLNVPFLRGMRDSQKFVALLVLVYAYLGGLGVKDVKVSVEDYIEKRFGDRTLGEVFGKVKKVSSL
jgi:hypothetical protein